MSDFEVSLDFVNKTLDWKLRLSTHSYMMLEPLKEVIRHMKLQLEEYIDHMHLENTFQISKLFILALSSYTFGYQMSKNQIALVYNSLSGLMDNNGGFRPSNYGTKKKMHYPRVYSTYYSIALLEILGLLDQFVHENDEWIRLTIDWILSSQSKDEGVVGAVVEKDAPSSIAPEYAYWAIKTLKLLGEYHDLDDRQFKTFTRDIKLWCVSFLSNQEFWSITRLTYLLMLLDTFAATFNLDKLSKESILSFLERTHLSGGFTEFDVIAAKKKYRKDDTYVPSLILSTFNALQIAQILGEEKKYEEWLSEAKSLVLENKNGNEFGVQIYIKRYEYGPKTTPYETFIACLILLL